MTKHQAIIKNAELITQLAKSIQMGANLSRMMVERINELDKRIVELEADRVLREQVND